MSQILYALTLSNNLLNYHNSLYSLRLDPEACVFFISTDRNLCVKVWDCLENYDPYSTLVCTLTIGISEFITNEKKFQIIELGLDYLFEHSKPIIQGMIYVKGVENAKSFEDQIEYNLQICGPECIKTIHRQLNPSVI